MEFIYNKHDIKLIVGDSLKVIKEFDRESIDVIICDPPYFLSSGGFSVSGGNRVSVNKGDWDNPGLYDPYNFYSEFLEEAKRILKPNGTIWIFGTMHNIYLIGYLLEKLEYKILNNITWQKLNPPPNISCRMFTHSTETIIWAKRDVSSKHYFNYNLMKELNNNKQMKDVWTSSLTKKSEKKMGKHPTQKPLEIYERMILASTRKSDIILDPFLGSGTAAVSSLLLDRQFYGIELEETYIDLSIRRIEEAKNNHQLSFFK